MYINLRTIIMIYASTLSAQLHINIISIDGLRARTSKWKLFKEISGNTDFIYGKFIELKKMITLLR